MNHSAPPTFPGSHHSHQGERQHKKKHSEAISTAKSAKERVWPGIEPGTSRKLCCRVVPKRESYH
ncbi:uncharacterized protein BKA55DRAFT_564108 [Fusarium redolens]|uniref:Uncharacterized protein n=1 Tax=Fusarium redolens TaxID=48865 RepID=A0A9P9KFM1_FUSRE|nr:uncharacterized protein BKA55DRAFT_564108 [Fusarium redolens]KAH7255450.1 hypothetical protein BKA55DRAFT_564108 [Fusarium redolens]